MSSKTLPSSPSRSRALLALGLVATLGAATGAVLAQGTSSSRLGAIDLGTELRRPRFFLANVHFLGLQSLAAEDLWSLTGIATNTPLVDVDTSEVARTLRGHPRIEAAQALRLPPGSLVIAVRERVPVARDATNGEGLDADGNRFPLAPRDAAALPSVGGDARRALSVVAAAKQLGVPLASIQAASESDVRVRPADLDVEVRLGRDVRASLSDWIRVRESGLVEARGAREVDLRFRGGAVLRSPNIEGGKSHGSS
jgi:cell division septal protein FtsQ